MASSPETNFKLEIEKEIKSHKVMLYSKSYCGYCNTAKSIFKKHKVDNIEIKELDLTKNGCEIQDALEKLTIQRTVPNIFINGKHIGGCSDLEKLEKKGDLAKLLGTH